MLVETGSESTISRFRQVDSRLIHIAVFTCLYIPYVCARALVKPLWFDELATMLIARVDSVATIFRLLYAGVDPQPPLSFLAVRWSLLLPGNELITARIPSMIGFWLMSVCMYLFAARRGAKPFAVLAMVLPCASGLFYYATEARPYAMVLGFAALALVAWQAIPESRSPWLARAVVLFSLSAAIFSHYYAILIPPALLTAEVARSIRRRQIDWWNIGAISGSWLVFVALRPMLTAQLQHLGVHWARPAFAAVIEFQQTTLVPLAIPLLTVAIAVAIYEAVTAEPKLRFSAPPIEDLVAVLSFLLIPIAAYLFGLFVSHTYTGRYSIAGLIGISLVFWWMTSWFFRGRNSAWVAAAVLSLLLGWDELRTVRRAMRVGAYEALQDYKPFPFPGDLPVVVQDGRDVLPMLHYDASDLARRILFLTNPSLAMKYTGSLGLDMVMIDLKQCAPLPVEDYYRFIATHRRFLLFWGKSQIGELGGWEMTKLREDGADLRVVEQNQTRVLYEVNMREPGRGAATQSAGGL